MTYEGRNVYPIRGAHLIPKTSELHVEHIDSTGLNGVSIDVEGLSNYKILFNEMPGLEEHGAVMKTAILSKDSRGLVFTRHEDFIWLDSDGDTLHFGYNMKLLPKFFNVIGKLDGIEVFTLEMQNPIFEDCCDDRIRVIPWVAIGAIAAVVAAGAAVYTALKTSTTSSVNNSYCHHCGALLSSTIVTTKDPTPFEILVDGATYLVDEFGIEYTEKTQYYGHKEPEDCPAVVIDYTTEDVALEITGTNLDVIEIYSITGTVTTPIDLSRRKK
ncbi:MAG: hypothetical protein FWG85_03560 [Bacteroidetes bacterium]|nr:hypothetical protein [Bacteroidota bacterium]